MKYQHQYVMYDRVESKAYFFVVSSSMNRRFRNCADCLSRDVFPLWDKIVRKSDGDEFISLPPELNNSMFFAVIIDKDTFHPSHEKVEFRSLEEYLISLHRYFRNIF